MHGGFGLLPEKPEKNLVEKIFVIRNWSKLKSAFIYLPILLGATVINAGVLVYGDMDALGTGAYGVSDPTAGATLQGLSAGSSTFASLATGHVYPFSPSPGDYPGTDQIYVGQVQTGAHDGYSVAAERINGPQIITLDFSSLVPAGNNIDSFTLGIAADDFQQPAFGQPFTASIDGVMNPALTSLLNGSDLGGPVVQFFTLGLDPTLLNPGHSLTLTIDEGGDGGDGWAVDFLTVGVTVSPAPEPSSFALLATGALAIGGLRRYRRVVALPVRN
jgi:hypothetical protein